MFAYFLCKKEHWALEEKFTPDIVIVPTGNYHHSDTLINNPNPRILSFNNLI